MDPKNMTRLTTQEKFPKEDIINLRKKFIWYIFAAGGSLLLLAITLLMIHYVSVRRKRNQNVNTSRIRNRPLPSLPNPGHRSGISTLETDELNRDYIMPVHRVCSSLDVRRISGEIAREIRSSGRSYLHPVIEDNLDVANLQESNDRTIPPLPDRDYFPYANNAVSNTTSSLFVVSPININGNFQQLNIAQGSARLVIGGLDIGKN